MLTSSTAAVRLHDCAVTSGSFDIPGVSSASADALLERMLNKIDELCAERDQLKKEQPGHNKGKVFGGRHW